MAKKLSSTKTDSALTDAENALINDDLPAIAIQWGTSWIVVGNAQGKGAPVNSPSVCKAVLHAAMLLNDPAEAQKRYPVLEMGLHLKDTIEHTSFTVATAFGYLSPQYAGTDPRLQALKPAAGWVSLSSVFGTLSARPVEVLQPQKGEAEWVTHNRKAHLLHSAIDALKAGTKFFLAPVFTNDDSETGLTSTEKALQFVARYQTINGMTAEERNQSYWNMVESKKTVRSDARTYAKIEAKADDVLATKEDTIEIDGEPKTFEECKGWTVQRYFHGCEVAGSRTLETVEDFTVIYASVKQHGYDVIKI
jgi:hypothetical protein